MYLLMNNTVKEMVDYLVKLSDDDIELHQCLVWVRKEAVRRGIGFDDMIILIFNQHAVNQRAKEWVHDRISS